ncbi:hypothetical protein JXA59_00185 [Patescibacteria group bacterium]|nr:hypothetical protein [Patescibacteria group bacterium]
MAKQKLAKILKWSTAGLLAIGLVLITYVGITYAQDATGGTGYGGYNFWAGLGVAFLGLLAKFFGIIGETIAGVIMPIVMQVLDALLREPDWVFSANSPLAGIIDKSHEAALILANSFLLLGLVIASVAIILRVGTGTYNIKKFLGSFVIMAILANASLALFKALLEVGDALFNSVDFLFVGGTIGIDRDIILAYLKDLASMRIDIGGNVAGTILVLTAILISAWVLIRVALLLLERTIFLFIMLVISPIAFGLSVLPTTQKMASQWIENIIKWILALPITYAILALGVFVLKQIGSGTPGQISEFITNLGKSIDVVHGGGLQLSTAPLQIAAGPANTVKDLLMFIIGLTIIYMGATIPKMLKIGGALTGLVESPGKLTGLGQKAYKGIADTLTGKNLPGKAQQRVRGSVGSMLNLATGWLKGTRADRLQNLGTQFGAVPEAWTKGFAAIGSARKTDRETSAREKLGATAGRLVNYGKWGKDISKSLLSGEVGYIHKEIADRSRSIPSIEKLRGAIETASDPYAFMIEMGRANKLISAPGVPREYRQQVFDFVRSKRGKFTGEQKKWDEIRSRIKPLSYYYWDSDEVQPPRGMEDADVEETSSAGGTRTGGVQYDSIDNPVSGGQPPTTLDQGGLPEGTQFDTSNPVGKAIATAHYSKEGSSIQQKILKTAELEAISSKPTNRETIFAAGEQIQNVAQNNLNEGANINDVMNVVMEQTGDLSGGANDAIRQTAQKKLETAGLKPEGAKQIVEIASAMPPDNAQALLQLQRNGSSQNLTLTQLIAKLRGMQKDLDALEGDFQKGVAARISGDQRHYGEAVTQYVTAQVDSGKAVSPATVFSNLSSEANTIYNTVYGSVREQVIKNPESQPRVDQALSDQVYTFLEKMNIRPEGATREEFLSKDAGEILSQIRIAREVIDNLGETSSPRTSPSTGPTTK